MPNLTLLDWAKRRDPDGTTPIIANLLSQTNEILSDAVYVQGNLPTGHQVTIATGLPTVYYRKLNEGIPTSKATTAQVTESCAILEAMSEVDLDLINLEDDQAAFRLSEARMFIESMNQTMATGMFYGDPTVSSDQFLGLAPRYSSLSAGNAQNIIDAAVTAPTTAQQTSVWLVCWGDQTVFCTYPKGSRAGLLQEDLGRLTSFDTSTDGSTPQPGRRMQVLAERYQWKTGLVVKDWRYVVRICNLEVPALADPQGTEYDAWNNDASATGGPVMTNLIHQMAKAISRIPNLRMGRPVFYVNRTVFTNLLRIGLEKSSSAVTVQPAATQFGMPDAMLSFLGIPIRQCDAILTTEDIVT